MNDRLEIAALTENLDKVIGFINAHLERAGCTIKAQMQIEVAAEELFVNIANYAYAPGTGTASVIVSCENGTAEITFIDKGIPYDPLAKPDPDLTLAAHERPIGGLGILMVKKTMDSVAYKRENNCNILTITKRIG